jgi:DNA processing protein
METENTISWLSLALTPGISAYNFRALIDSFDSLEQIQAASHIALSSKSGISADAAMSLSTGSSQKVAEQELQKLEKIGASILPYSSPTYPELLRQLPDPPILFQVLGEIVEQDQLCVSIVGSRKCSAYGTQVAHRLAGDLAERGITIVSGMAHGIDQAAHNGALAAGGRTVAVIGSGLGNIYPSNSSRLVERIVASGAVVSEFPYNTPPTKGTFPQRNRIVSGISPITLVIEAAERSGALITSRLALEQGRDLLAVPGPIYEPRSFGSNYLIKSGAKLVQTAQDVIDELPEHLFTLLEQAAEKRQPGSLSEEQTAIISLLSVDRPMHVDIIAAHSGFNLAKLAQLLLELEMDMVVKQLPGSEYIKAI